MTPRRLRSLQPPPQPLRATLSPRRWPAAAAQGHSLSPDTLTSCQPRRPPSTPPYGPPSLERPRSVAPRFPPGRPRVPSATAPLQGGRGLQLSPLKGLSPGMLRTPAPHCAPSPSPPELSRDAIGHRWGRRPGHLLTVLLSPGPLLPLHTPRWRPLRPHLPPPFRSSRGHTNLPWLLPSSRHTPPPSPDPVAQEDGEDPRTRLSDLRNPRQTQSMHVETRVQSVSTSQRRRARLRQRKRMLCPEPRGRRPPRASSATWGRPRRRGSGDAL